MAQLVAKQNAILADLRGKQVEVEVSYLPRFKGELAYVEWGPYGACSFMVYNKITNESRSYYLDDYERIYFVGSDWSLIVLRTKEKEKEEGAGITGSATNLTNVLSPICGLLGSKVRVMEDDEQIRGCLERISLDVDASYQWFKVRRKYGVVKTFYLDNYDSIKVLPNVRAIYLHSAKKKERKAFTLPRELHHALKVVEWVRFNSTSDRQCAWCGHTKEEGHTNTCTVGAALKRANEAGYDD